MKEFRGWIAFREWYYKDIIKREFNGRPNTNLRRGRQEREQEFFDDWRKNMGYDAPWTNADMVLYDNKSPIAIVDVKVGSEKFSDANHEALLNLARMASLPLYEFRWFPGEKVEVSLLWSPTENVIQFKTARAV